MTVALSQGIFPTELKLAILKPIFKSGVQADAGNFRPVSLLTIMSKIYEKIFYTRLHSFLLKYKIIYELQFGFRRGHSTEMAIITLLDKIIQALEKGIIQ